MGSLIAFSLCFVLACSLSAAQVLPTLSAEGLTVSKIDPPDWFSGLPKPLLLVNGTGLTGARFTLSDPALHIERTTISANGHWAQLYLSAAPTAPETVTISVASSVGSLQVPYRFNAPHASTDGIKGFNPRDVLYLVMTDRFADGDLHNDGLDAHSEATGADAIAERAKSRGWHGGDLKGVSQHLDYLQKLGVTAVWITPVYTNAEPQAYHGYHATDYYSVDPHLGTIADLKHLANALHARGMKLVLDSVPNHVGPAHPWLNDEPTPEWFHGTAANHLKATFDFYDLISPHAPERDKETILHGWFADALPDMNTEDPVVAQYLRQNAIWWIEQTGADALRIDTFAFADRPFWHEFNGELHDLFPNLTEVGEVYDPHPEITSAFADGVTRAGVDTRLYTPFDFPTYFALRDVFAKGKSMKDLVRVLDADTLYPHPERLVPFVGNHDTSRFAEVVPDPALRKLAFAYLFTSRGMPQIYAGDEIAMQGGDDPANRQDFPGGFPDAREGSSENAFTESGRTPEQQASYAWIRDLLELRRDHPVLACGAEQVLKADTDTLVFTRYGTSGCVKGTTNPAESQVLVILQRGAKTPISLDLRHTAAEGCAPGRPLMGEADVVLAGVQMTVVPTTGTVILPCLISQPVTAAGSR